MRVVRLISLRWLSRGFHLERLRTEHATNPIGIDEPAPRLSWTLHSDRRGTRQTAYDVRVATHADSLAAPLWTSGRVSSTESVLRPYGGPALRPGRRYHWQVRAWAAPPAPAAPRAGASSGR